MIDFEKDGGSVTPNDSVFHFSEKTVRHGRFTIII